MVKHCEWGTCNSDSRYPERLINSDGICVKFYHFPSFKNEKMRREAWIRACCRADSFVCTKHSYICGFHFVGGNGPTDQNPDPVPATASREKVGQTMFILNICAILFVLLAYLMTPCCFAF